MKASTDLGDSIESFAEGCANRWRQCNAVLWV